MAPFAVVSTTAGFQAAYDPNGNMVLRVENGVTYRQEWDAENRLAVVTNTATGEMVRFIYDGDGKRILRIGPEGTTVYIGDYYEKQGPGVTKHYYAGGQRVAVRVNGTLYFLHTDHLGSTTLLTDQSQQAVARRWYRPYGDTRYAIGEMPTDRLYTGQRWDSALALYDYRARYYDPVLGRFVSADPLVPEPGNPQALNRYAYVLNNPLRYTDPSGHWLETLWDIANIAWDIYEVQRDPSLLNIACLVVDVGAAIIPFVPGGVGAIVHGGKAVKVGLEAASHVDEVVDAGRVIAEAVSHADEAVDALRAAERAGKEAGEGIARTIHHHIATNKNWIRDPQWSRDFQELFARGGLSLDDLANIVELPAEWHKGPHAQAYHQWVHRRLQEAIAGLEDPVQIRAALEARLRGIAEQLKAHPEWLRNPPMPR